MAIDTFDYCVQIGASGSVPVSVYSAQFGDGYKQVAENGINPVTETWDLVAKGSPSEMQEVRNFLASHCASFFAWTNPWGEKKLYRVKPDSIKPTFVTGQWVELNFTFESEGFVIDMADNLEPRVQLLETGFSDITNKLSQKADSSAVSDISDRVTAAEKAIASNTDALATKANTTDLAAKANSSQLGYALIDAGNVGVNKRYTFTNPFGKNTPVMVMAEVYANNLWADTGFYSGTGSRLGTKASYVESVGIVVQTGDAGIGAPSNFTGGGHGATADLATPAPCRIHVWKVAN